MWNEEIKYVIKIPGNNKTNKNEYKFRGFKVHISALILFSSSNGSFKIT